VRFRGMMQGRMGGRQRGEGEKRWLRRVFQPFCIMDSKDKRYAGPLWGGGGMMSTISTGSVNGSFRLGTRDCIYTERGATREANSICR
jgi:putative NADPH-quinone reductase